jgi:sulfoxide reductase heme-binding subunit YedZ
MALLLMTAVMLIGLLVVRNGKLPGLPRFAVTGLHRNLSLVGVVFVALHVITTVADSYVSIPLTAVFVPLTSGYERLALSLGAVSIDLTIAVIVTSLIRSRMNAKTWRVIHLLAYLSWPVAWLHSYTAASDLHSGWMLALAAITLLAVVAATGWRFYAANRDVPRAERVGRVMSAVHRVTGPMPAHRDSHVRIREPHSRDPRSLDPHSHRRTNGGPR